LAQLPMSEQGTSRVQVRSTTLAPTCSIINLLKHYFILHCLPEFFLVSVLISSCNLLIPFPVSDVGDVLLISSPVLDVPSWFWTKCFNSETNN